MREMLEKFDYGYNTTFVSFSPLYTLTDLGKLQEKESRRHQNNRNVQEVNCRLLFEGSEKEILKARNSNLNEERLRQRIISQTKNCNKFIDNRGYIMDSLSEEEKNFPIAYGIMVYKNPEQFEILLRAIYRPQNFYCVHVDRKTSENVYQEFASIVNCFPNVFLSSQRVVVNWGEMGVLLSQITCMIDLLKQGKWKYFINLTGQEFPLRTNHELVKILKIYNGFNDIEGTIDRTKIFRWASAGWPPHQIRLVKGSVLITASREYVQYVIKSRVAFDFLKWVRNTELPDETFFSSLNHNPQLGIPGSYKGKPQKDPLLKPFLTRFVNWYGTEFPCGGEYVTDVCILGITDLPLLARRPELFANKFYVNNQPYTLRCLEELHFNRTRDEYFGKLHFQTDYYESLKFIKNIVK
ncbi:beta-1,3-galactosyl-O-glycosyl-glycoprotein beta-1,6-N-acetylglucosaminyltransferase-like [Saccostrea echinata]|uniref:beta-1,3-galactosyl-O-glycosyl-glycoprotein beta-1,6-N-acetylglucosaminyltransferase-like n=1 Tax=Saccostrea echinata TaxID=191078 RepID=UPI002A7F09E2|nr:beta-1,3-galactosyl-O-glycosyl-glycoprotein beta-1,6-N-acetylglucosaminyltransferase-like [Saccostrea echinata]